MTKYNRITGKVFGGNANATGDNPEIGQFGSAKDGSYIGTSDISSIQALPAWGKGWIGAVTPETNFPPLPEMTGAMKVFSEQQCYLLQQGIPEWDNATIYYKNGFSSKNGKIYISQSDENQGNDPEADTTNWKEFSQDKANKDLDNLTEAGEKHFLNKSQITNCLLEIPQKIKLELNDGTLTLKAGSQVIVPNGFEADGITPKFDEINIVSDISLTFTFAPSTNAQVMLFINNTGTSFVSLRLLGACFSGTTKPSGIYINWYNTTENKMYSIGANETVESSDFSFPIAIITQGSDGVTKSIDQVFNGMGYIGSTVWVDKGVKGLIPNGRNADGSLKNIEFETERVLTYTFTTNWLSANICGIALNSSRISIHEFTYNSEMNKLDIGGFAWVGNIKLKNDGTSGINWIRPKTAFHAVDYSDKSEISGWGMPSNRYIDLTVGASGTTYTAPANGWFSCNCQCNQDKPSSNMYFALYNNSNETGDMRWFTNATNLEYKGMIPCRKGDIISIGYSAKRVFIDTWERGLRFYYAEGEQ